MENQLKILRTSLLKIGYFEQGPADGKPIILLHGWPDDAHTWDDVTRSLAEAGWRTFAPYLRGFGPTRFLDADTRRSGQVTAIAQDAKEFVDALELEKFTLVGHDWGGRAAYQFAVNWPERLERMVTLSVPYGGGPNQAMSTAQRKAYWYQWFFGTEQAQHTLKEDRNTLCRFLWETWMAKSNFNEAEFTAAAESWKNPDWVEITLHSYRHRWGLALPDPQYDALEAKQILTPPITVPTIVLHGAEDGASLAASTEGQEALFTGGYRREVLPGVGHFIQREQPEAVVKVIIDPGV
ncbi:MAG: alpha/beta fold hydrolase [Janthinobacterium lividum]